ncbi:MAG: MaoC/PaaZ C-terminal domain-containing protein [Gammaproteobacteria bacterium]
MTDLQRFVGTCVDQREVSYSAADVILHALTLGFGTDPLDARQLRFVTEDHLAALPTLPLVLGYPGVFMREPSLGLAWAQMLHAEEHLELHRTLPPAGIVRDRTWVDAVVDRGTAKGAFVHTRKELHSENDGLLLATVRSTILCRGDGGGGSAGQPPTPYAPVPERRPDLQANIGTLAQQALFYRLCGDSNPVHADPAVAAQAGFSRPLLHGRCTFGHALHVILAHCCNYDAAAIAAARVRFAAPFYPGETLRVSCWREWRQIHFSAECVERHETVLSHGLVELRD